MDRTRGFTLVELLVTMAIMVILVTFAVVNLRGSQATVRDEERKTDASIIAQNLENYYRSGPAGATGGTYPPTSAMSTEALIKSTLRDIDAVALRVPTIPTSSPVSLVVASTTSAPSPSINAFVYQPLKSDGSLCTLSSEECRKFNLYYTLESDNSLQKIVSKNQ